MKIYEFEIYKKKVTFKELGRLGEAEGRYRHESVLHNDVIYSIGGSNDQVFFPCNAVSIYGLKKSSCISDNWLQFKGQHILFKTDPT